LGKKKNKNHSFRIGILGGQVEDSVSILNSNLRSDYTNLEFVGLSQEHQGRRNLGQEKMEMGKVRVMGHPHPIYQGYYTISVLSLDIFEPNH
jgi:hypothetical protein